MGEYGRLAGARRSWSLVAAGMALLLAAWAFANPPGAAPDERGHYVRALGAGNLELSGGPFVPDAAAIRSFLETGASGGKPVPGSGVATIVWTAKQTRSFAVPRRLSRTTFGCNDGSPMNSAACLDAAPVGRPTSRAPSYTGTYPPFVYVVPGAAMRTASTPAAALRLGRALSALLSLVLLAAAAWLLLAAGDALFAAFAVAVTPMVVFCASSLNASGPEIAAALCLVAAGLAVHRSGAGAGAWAALALSGAVLALSRSLGPVLLLALTGALVLLHGPRVTRRALRERPHAAAGAGALLLAALAIGVWWEIARQPHGIEGGPTYRFAFAQSVYDLDDVARHAIGSFGALDTSLPAMLYAVWAAAAGGLVALAGVVGSARERAGIALTLGVALAVTMATSVFQLRHGYGVQGRHVLPVLVLVPLWCGEVLRRHSAGRGWLVPAAFALFAGGQALAWWVNARRHAVGTDGSWWFFGSAEWSPPGGWWPWAVLALAGSALVLAGGLLQAQRSSRSRLRSTPPSATTTTA